MNTSEYLKRKTEYEEKPQKVLTTMGGYNVNGREVRVTKIVSYVCGKCGSRVVQNLHPNYCGSCGNAIHWFLLDEEEKDNE